MLALEFVRRKENQGGVVVSSSFAEVRKAKDGWWACLRPIPPAMGLCVSHFEVNQAHPTSPAKYRNK